MFGFDVEFFGFEVDFDIIYVVDIFFGVGFSLDLVG